MRGFCLTLAGVCMLAGNLTAQQTQPAAGALDPQRNRLDALLVRWEQEMKNTQTLLCNCSRTTLDKTFQVTEIYEGSAKYMKPNLAMLEMKKKDKPEVFEKYICSGTYLYEYALQNKEVRAHELPPTKPGQEFEDNVLSFLFGLKAEEAKRRYELKLAKEDQWYVYIEIQPKAAADKADFQRARVVLNNKTFLPRELWFEQPNGNEVKWDIPEIKSNPNLSRNDFTNPQIPPGWELKRVPRSTTGGAQGNVPPRVVRPQK